MTEERHTIWQLADKIQMDLRAAQGKMVELRAQLASLDLPEPSTLRCPTCGVPCRGPNTLAEHVYNSHAGPVPEHYKRIEDLSDDPELDTQATDVASGLWPDPTKVGVKGVVRGV